MYMEAIEARVSSLCHPSKVRVNDPYRIRVSFLSYTHHGLSSEAQILRRNIWYNRSPQVFNQESLLTRDFKSNPCAS